MSQRKRPEPRPERVHAAGATPLLLAKDSAFTWPEHERHFTLIARDGLFTCRNHELFTSCVRAERGPGQLEAQHEFLEPRFPMLPRALFERSVGFFAEIARRHGAEAAALLYWDRAQRRVQLHIPEQTATVTRYSDGYTSPIGVHYTPPTDLPEAWVPFGDIHCHVHYSAYASATDKDDELHSTGLHIVVGRIREEPPDVHVEAVVDGRRFRLEARQVIEGYRARDHETPQAWLDQVSIEQLGSGWRSGQR